MTQIQNNKPADSNGTHKRPRSIERFSSGATRWIGSDASLLTHTFLFIGAFIMTRLGFSIDRVLLILTTIVSLEAIYLAIFIQMTINRTTAQLEDVEETVGEISEDVEEIQENVEDIQGDVEDIQEDVEEISVSEMEEPSDEMKLEKIEQSLLTIVKEIEELKKSATPKS